jgi:hypothetical protein
MEEVNEIADSKEEVKKDKKGNIKYVLKSSGRNYIL